jgi:hypothetical protein
MPAFIGLTGYLALGGFATLIGATGMTTDDTISYFQRFTVLLYWILYLGSFTVLVVHARWWPSWGIKKPHNVLNWLWNFRVAMNAFIMILNAFVLTGLVIVSFVSPGSLKSFAPEDIIFLRFVFAFTIFYSLSPFYLGLMCVLRIPTGSCVLCLKRPLPCSFHAGTAGALSRRCLLLFSRTT